MPIASMTGFARAEGQDDQFSWAWEIRSVNGKGLDMRVRTPSGWERLDPKVRGAVQKTFRRGSLSINLDVRALSSQNAMQVNRAFLSDLVALCREEGQDANVDRLLNVRGVIESTEDQSQAVEDDTRVTAVLKTLDEALAALAKARKAEGQEIEEVLDARLGEIDALVVKAETEASNLPETIKSRLQEQIADLVDSGAGVSEERLAQEIVLLANKADVREELDRLKAHVAAGRQLLSEKGAIGRKFDFLCQEFNREANTLCSKSAAIEMTQIGLELKSIVDQLREQVANIE